MVAEWVDNHRATWTGKHAGLMQRILERDLLPEFGDQCIADISSMAVLQALRKIEYRQALDTARKARQICNQVFVFAIASGRAVNNPASGLHAAMKPQQARASKPLCRDHRYRQAGRATAGDWWLCRESRH